MHSREAAGAPASVREGAIPRGLSRSEANGKGARPPTPTLGSSADAVGRCAGGQLLNHFQPHHAAAAAGDCRMGWRRPGPRRGTGVSRGLSARRRRTRDRAAGNRPRPAAGATWGSSCQQGAHPEDDGRFPRSQGFFQQGLGYSGRDVSVSVYRERYAVSAAVSFLGRFDSRSSGTNTVLPLKTGDDCWIAE